MNLDKEEIRRRVSRKLTRLFSIGIIYQKIPDTTVDRYVLITLRIEFTLFQRKSNDAFCGHSHGQLAVFHLVAF